jgi:hypothetical protein
VRRRIVAVVNQDRGTHALYIGQSSDRVAACRAASSQAGTNFSATPLMQ